MSQFSLYRAYIKQRRTSGSTSAWQDVLPMEISYTDGSGHTTVIEENSTHCGYEPQPDPQYRWVNIPISQDYECDATTYTKYYKQKRQVSYDNGATWNDVTPAQYQRGGVYESQSIDCGYIAPGDMKYTLHLKGGTDIVYPCDSWPTLAHTQDGRISITSAFTIGDCVTRISQYVINTYNRGNDITSVVNISSSVTTIDDHAFFGCHKLSGITLPENVTSIGDGAFNFCESLTVINSLNTTPPVAGSYVFGDAYTPLTCPIYVPTESTLEYVMADGWHRYYLNIFPADFPNISGKALIVYDNHSYSVVPDNGNTTLTMSEISPSSSITCVYITNKVTSIGNNAFSGCTSLVRLYMPDTITSFGNNAFSDCTSLIDFNSSTVLTSIGDEAFRNCSSLRHPKLPNTLTSIGSYAFSGTSIWEMVIYATAPPTINTYSFRGTNGFNIYVPDESIKTYMLAPIWEDIKSRLQKISNY